MTKPSSFCHYASVELFYEELDEMEVTAMLRCLELEVPASVAPCGIVTTVSHRCTNGLAAPGGTPARPVLRW